MQKTVHLTISLFIGALFMSNVLAHANNYTQPYYTIEFTAQRLGFEIRVNDIPIFDIDNSGFMTQEVPINEYIVNGTNNITVITFPFFDDDDEQSIEYIDGVTLEISLYVREDSNKNSGSRELVSQAFIKPQLACNEKSELEVAILKKIPGSEQDLNITVTKNASTLNFPLYGVFNKQVLISWDVSELEVPFPLWAWHEGQVITDNKKSYKSLLEAYKKIHKAFLEKDLEKVKKINSQRSTELAISYYLGDKGNGFKYTAIGEYVDHPVAELYKQLYIEDTKLDILAKGKLARIMDGAGNHPVVFINDETGQIHSAQFMWYLNKNSEWILIR